MPGVAVLCSGQGRQDAAMFEPVLRHPEARVLLDRVRASGVLPAAAASFLDRPDADPDLLFRNECAQPLLCLHQMLVWEVVGPLLPTPEIVAGYSLGELSAYGCAGALRPEDVVRLAAVRGRLMSAAAAVPQTMAAVIGLRRERLGEICAGFGAEIAVVNGIDHFVCGLPLERADAFLAACGAAGARRTVRLPVAAASHTSFMKDAADAFAGFLREAEFRNPTAGVLAGVDGGRVFGAERAVAALTEQMRRTVDWRACMESAVSYGCRVFLETGPGRSLAAMIAEAFPGVEARSVSEFGDIRAVALWLKNAGTASCG